MDDKNKKNKALKKKDIKQYKKIQLTTIRIIMIGFAVIFTYMLCVNIVQKYTADPQLQRAGTYYEMLIDAVIWCIAGCCLGKAENKINGNNYFLRDFLRFMNLFSYIIGCIGMLGGAIGLFVFL